MTPEFFAGLGEAELQGRLLQALVDILLNTSHSEVIVQVKEGVAKVGPLFSSSNDYCYCCLLVYLLLFTYLLVVYLFCLA